MSTFASTMSTFTMSTCVHGAGPVRGAEAAFGSGRYQVFGAVDDVNFRTRFQFLRMGQDQFVAQKQLRLNILSAVPTPYILLKGPRTPPHSKVDLWVQLVGSRRIQFLAVDDVNICVDDVNMWTKSTFAHGAGPVRGAEAAAPNPEMDTFKL